MVKVLLTSDFFCTLKLAGLRNINFQMGRLVQTSDILRFLKMIYFYFWTFNFPSPFNFHLTSIELSKALAYIY